MFKGTIKTNNTFIKNTKRIIKKLLFLPTIINNNLNEWNSKSKWLSPNEIADYRKKIKIYDVFMFFNELDLLEMRLNILNERVDYFVIVEATETFSGHKKPLYYAENRERFKQWGHKIIHYIIDDTPKDENDARKRFLNAKIEKLEKQTLGYLLKSNTIGINEIAWFKEFYQKESIKNALVKLNDDDICYISDLDEIWNPCLLIDYSKDDIFKPKQTAYVYYLNNRSDENYLGWSGTIVTKYKNIKDACLNDMRTAKKNKYIVLRDGGWHFTFQGGINGAKTKLASYQHPEYNTEKTIRAIEKQILINQDYKGRNFKFWKDEKGLPEYLLNNKEKYKKFFK